MQWAELVNIGAYHLSSGSFGSSIGGAPVLLLTVSGRRTGARRTKPLLALPDGDGWIVVASRAGTADNPQWFENLMAFEADPGRADLAPPVAEAEGHPPTPVRAQVLEGEERDRWWAALNAVYPNFEAYQGRTARRIPVLRLHPVHTDGGSGAGDGSGPGTAAKNASSR